MRGYELISIEPENLSDAVERLVKNGGRMQMIYAWRPAPSRLELRYVASAGAREEFLVWRCIADGPIQSLACISPLLGWHEREISDLFGLKFIDHPEPYHLVLHDGAAPIKPPLDPAYPFDARMPFEPTDRGAPEVESVDVQRMPFGPVRADVVESGELVFFYIGEHILHLHPQLFFKHRGMEKRFEGRSLANAAVLAERVSGVDSVAHALAFCQAVECAAACSLPPRALMLGSLLAELERLYNHLHYLGHLAHTTTLKVGEAQGKLLEERAKQINRRLTGRRFLRSLLIAGGLRRDLNPKPWLGETLAALREEAAAYTAMLETTNSHLDRLMTTGVLSPKIAFDQGATGPIDRASGLDRDLRRDHPYAAYDALPLAVPIRTAGDAHARAQVRIGEIDARIVLMQRILLLMADGPICGDCAPRPVRKGSAGRNRRAGHCFTPFISATKVRSRVKIKSPSFSNWRVFQIHRSRQQHDGLRHQ